MPGITQKFGARHYKIENLKPKYDFFFLLRRQSQKNYDAYRHRKQQAGPQFPPLIEAGTEKEVKFRWITKNRRF